MYAPPLFALVLTAFTLISAASASEPANPVHDTARNLIAEKCLACHSGQKPKGGLDLTTRPKALAGGENGPAFLDGKTSAESLLFERVSSGEMPPKSPLSEANIAAFKTWLNDGAPYPAEPLVARRAGLDWWSLQPIKRAEAPKVASERIRTFVDRFVLDKLTQKGLDFAPDASPISLIRRATFDLTGLPPTPEEVDAFLKDPSPNAYESLIDRLLASPAYGERWGRHWLDVVRFGESHGYEMNQPRPNAWPYRDYVIRAFNRDTPYPRFLLEQLAGDTLPDNEADLLTRAATGFIVGGTHDQVGNGIPEVTLQQRADDLDDIITATSSAFLGLTMNCARCHDHKFDPIMQKDYYAMQSIFAGVKHEDRPIPAADTPERRDELAQATAELSEIERKLEVTEPPADPTIDKPIRSPVKVTRNVERFAPIVAKGVRFVILATNSAEPCIDELEVWTADGKKNVALASEGGKPSSASNYPDESLHKLANLNDGFTGNSQSWISGTSGRGRVQIDWPEARAVDRVVWGRDREGAYLDRLATAYYVEILDESGKWRVVASSSDRQNGVVGSSAAASVESPERAALRKEEILARQRVKALRDVPKIYAGTFSQPGPSNVFLRGDPTRKGEAVVPSSPSALSPKWSLAADAPEADRRLALARWLGDPANPLPARVMVNRAWHYHFGQGIVATPSDFGFNGAPPSHPELLDWLASEYISNGFHLKTLHKIIMLSTAYRQSTIATSEMSDKGMSLDKTDRLLWRFPPRRLEAEPVRDAVLAVSGKLNLKMGGPGYSPWEKNTNYVAVYNPKAVLGPDEFRRMVYQFKPKSRLDPTFGAFDCPDGGLVAPRRTVSTTALQALSLLNSRFLVDRADDFAERLKNEAGADVSAQVVRAFKLAFSRPPSETEAAASVKLIGSHGLSAFCRALLNSNEFLYLN